MSDIDKIKSLKDDINFIKDFKNFREDVEPDPELVKALDSALECMEKELTNLLKAEEK